MVVDTNLIVRLILKDNISQHDRFKKFLGTGVYLTLTPLIIAECFYVLTEVYKHDKPTALMHLRSFMTIASVIVVESPVMFLALDICENYNISLVDSYICAYSLCLENGEVLSFDRDISKVPGIKRIEP